MHLAELVRSLRSLLAAPGRNGFGAHGVRLQCWSYLFRSGSLTNLYPPDAWKRKDRQNFWAILRPAWFQAGSYGAISGQHRAYEQFNCSAA